MSMDLLFKGLIIGFSIAMPVGPIGLLCMRNVLTFGIICGLFTGLGAACADSIYGAIAGFGVTAISTFMEANNAYFKIIGAIFLCYLGISTFCTKMKNSTNKVVTLTGSKVFLTTFFLTLTNPMTIISFTGIYAGLGIGNDGYQLNGAFSVTFGVFLGSAAWWLILSLVTLFFKDKISTTQFTWLNRLSGSVLFGFGAFALIA